MTEIQTADAPEAPEAPEAARAPEAPEAPEAQEPGTSPYGRQILRGVDLASLRILPDHKRLAKQDTDPVEGVDEHGVTGPVVVFRDPEHGLTVYVGARRVLKAIELGVKSADVEVQTRFPSGREYLEVAPDGLRIELNVRKKPKLSKKFLKSVETFGVEAALDAFLDLETGAPVVWRGQRRTLAALKQGLATVPVIVWPPMNGDERKQTRDRVKGQVRENDDRDQMDGADYAGAVLTLFDQNVSVTQIGRDLSMPKAQVQAAIASRGSAGAQSALQGGFHMEELAIALDLEARLPGAMERLEAAKAKDRFGLVVAELEIEAERTAARDNLVAGLREQKVRVVEESEGWQKVRGLSQLKGPGGGEMTVEDHAACPGHAALVWPLATLLEEYYEQDRDTEFRPEAEWVCTDVPGNGHKGRWEHEPASRKQTPEQKAASKQARKWKPLMEAANRERLAWVGTTFAKYLADGSGKNWEKWLLRVQVTAFEALVSAARTGHAGAAKALGMTMPRWLGDSVHPLIEDLEAISAKRAVGRLVLMAAYGHEAMFDELSWRTRKPELVAYLLVLKECGRELTPVEWLLVYGEEPGAEAATDEPAAEESAAQEPAVDPEDAEAEELLAQLQVEAGADTPAAD